MRIYLLLLILTLFSCYEDKGNYDYTTVNEIGIAGEYEMSYRVKMGDRLTIPIKLNLNGCDSSLLKFKWEFAIQNKLNPIYHTLAETKDFDQNITVAPANYDVRFSVYNKANGLTIYKKFSVEVTDAISKYTYLVLTRVPGTQDEYDISSANEFSRVGEPLYNLFSANNGSTIKNAKSIFYYASYSYPYFDNLVILKDKGIDKLSPFDLSWLGDENELFFETPENMSADFLLADQDFRQYFIVDNGKLHSCNTRYKPYKFSVIQKVPDNSDYDIRNYAYYYNYSGSQYVFLDNKEGRFVKWENRSKLLSFIDENDYYKAGSIKDYSVVYMGLSCKRTLPVFLKDKAGKVHKYIFGEDYSSWPFKYVVTNHEIFPDELEMDKASAVFPHLNSESVYYAVGDKIWLLNTITNTRVLFHDFEDDEIEIVEMHNRSAYSNLFFIAVNKGDVGYIYRFWVLSTGMTQDPNGGLFPLPKDPEMTVPYEVIGPYGKIVDIEYKSKTW